VAVASHRLAKGCDRAEPIGRLLCAPAPAAGDSPAKAFHTAAATVFVVDDNVGVRKSLRALLESADLTVETYASREEFLAAYDPERRGCLVLDVRLRHGSGLDLQDELRNNKSLLPIIVLTGYGDVPTSVRAIKGGAFDFLQKPAPPGLLLERIGAAIDFDHQAHAATTARAAVRERLAHLTPREREVMALLIEGKASKEIATALHVSVRTVEGHRRKVLAKANVSSAAQLVRSVRNATN
jgi:two-component system, LuxR family, response regulator FixJ